MAREGGPPDGDGPAGRPGTAALLEGQKPICYMEPGFAAVVAELVDAQR